MRKWWPTRTRFTSINLSGVEIEVILNFKKITRLKSALQNTVVLCFNCKLSTVFLDKIVLCFVLLLSGL